MSPWAWFGFVVLGVVVLGVLVFVVTAILAGVAASQREQAAGKACPRCGLPWGDPWPPPEGKP